MGALSASIWFSFGYKPDIEKPQKPQATRLNRFEIYFRKVLKIFKNKKNYENFEHPKIKMRRVRVVEFLSYENTRAARNRAVTNVKDFLTQESLNVYEGQLCYSNYGDAYLLEEREQCN